MLRLSELFARACYASVSAAAFGLFLAASQPLPKKPSWQVAYDATSAIMTTSFKENASAFHIGGGIWITARHALTSPDKDPVYFLKDPNGDLHASSPLMTSEEADIAVLISDTFPRESIELDCRVYPVGTEIEAVGSPSHVYNLTTFGKISSSPRANMLTSDSYFASIPGAPGMSGGPVSRNGRAIGVFTGISMGSVRGHSFGYGVSIVTLSRQVCGMLSAP